MGTRAADAMPIGAASGPNRGGEAALGRGLAVAAILPVAIDLRPGIVPVGPILPSIIEEFGLSHAAAALLIAIPDLLMGLLALPTPWRARRYGRDPVLLGALPLLVGILRDLSGDFRPSIWLLAGVGSAMLLSPFLRPHHQRSQARP